MCKLILFLDPYVRGNMTTWLNADLSCCNLSVMTSTNWTSCCASCRSTPTCGSYTFVISARNCYLKTASPNDGSFNSGSVFARNPWRINCQLWKLTDCIHVLSFTVTCFKWSLCRSNALCFYASKTLTSRVIGVISSMIFEHIWPMWTSFWLSLKCCRRFSSGGWSINSIRSFSSIAKGNKEKYCCHIWVSETGGMRYG